MQQQTIQIVQDEPNYWWLLLIGVIPVLVGILLNRKR